MTLSKLAAAAAFSLWLALAACGGDDDARGIADPGPSSSGTAAADAADPAGGVPDVAVEYLDALASGRVSDIGRMVELAADGSPAQLYGRYHLAWARYTGGTPSTSDVQADAIEQCAENTTPNGDMETVCTMFAAFEVDADGRLVTFSTDGSPIADRLRAGDPAGVTADGISAVVVASYQTSRGDLFITLDITNGGDGATQVDDCSATYVGRDSRQVNQSCVSLHPRVQPGSTASVVYSFEQVTPGGTMSLSVATDEREPGTYYDTVNLEVPVP